MCPHSLACDTAHRACAPSCAADTGTRGGSTVISRGVDRGGAAGADCKCGSACRRTANCFDDTTADDAAPFQALWLTGQVLWSQPSGRYGQKGNDPKQPVWNSCSIQQTAIAPQLPSRHKRSAQSKRSGQRTLHGLHQALQVVHLRRRCISALCQALKGGGVLQALLLQLRIMRTHAVRGIASTGSQAQSVWVIYGPTVTRAHISDHACPEVDRCCVSAYDLEPGAPAQRRAWVSPGTNRKLGAGCVECRSILTEQPRTAGHLAHGRPQVAAEQPDPRLHPLQAAVRAAQGLALPHVQRLQRHQPCRRRGAE